VPMRLVIECDNNCSETGARETLGLQFLYSHEATSRWKFLELDINLKQISLL